MIFFILIDGVLIFRAGGEITPTYAEVKMEAPGGGQMGKIPKLPETPDDPELFNSFEASNGLGKARASIIDSPDNGPVLFDSVFDKNEIGLIDTSACSGQVCEKIWTFPTGDEWVDEVVISADGSFLAASTGCPDRRAYIFSKDSDQPLVRSEMLTYDSPIQKVRISEDGSLAAFSTDGGPESSTVLLFGKSSKEPLWKFQESSRRAARALGMTPDGTFITVANFNGELYLLSKDSNQPVANWILHTSVGALDISNNGNIIAAGGTNKKVHLINRAAKSETDISFNEFVDTLAVSADGRYVVVGTGASPYFFEEIVDIDRSKVYECTTIIEPKPEGSSEFGQTTPRGFLHLPLVVCGAGFFLIATLVLALARTSLFSEKIATPSGEPGSGSPAESGGAAPVVGKEGGSLRRWDVRTNERRKPRKLPPRLLRRGVDYLHETLDLRSPRAQLRGEQRVEGFFVSPATWHQPLLWYKVEIGLNHINWTGMEYLNKNLQNRIEDKLTELNRLRPLPPSAVRKLREQFKIEMTYNSNGIEGNSLTLKETFLVINEGITVKGKPLKDHLEAKDHYEALEYLSDLVEKGKRHTTSERFIRNLHQLIMRETDKE